MKTSLTFKRALIIIVLFFIGLSIGLFVGLKAKQSALPVATNSVPSTPDVTQNASTTKQFVFSQLGVEVTVPSNFENFVYNEKTVQSIGTVLDVSTQSLLSDNKNCTLGAVYSITKKDLAKGSRATWTEDKLQAATIQQGSIAPQVKEFPLFYLVFEPSQSTCSKNIEQEARLRTALWNSIQTAKFIK